MKRYDIFLCPWKQQTLTDGVLRRKVRTGQRAPSTWHELIQELSQKAWKAQREKSVKKQPQKDNTENGHEEKDASRQEKDSMQMRKGVKSMDKTSLQLDSVR